MALITFVTAQHAIRQPRCWRIISWRQCAAQVPQPFKFKIIGLLATIGRRHGAPKFLAGSFPGTRVVAVAHDLPEQKKVRGALDWTLDMILSKDLVQLPTLRSSAMLATEHSSTATSHETDAAQVREA